MAKLFRTKKKFRLGRRVRKSRRKPKLKKRTKKVKKLKKKLRPVESKIAALAKIVRKRRPILVAVPSHRLYLCRAEGKRFAFMKGHGLFPLGLVQSIKRTRKEKRVLLYPFDTAEHAHVIKAVCAP